MRIVSAVLAAGKCQRFGLPKFLLQIGNKPIIFRIVEISERVFDSTVVISGFYHNEIKRTLKSKKIIYNQDFEKGMSSSIKTAVLYAENKNYDGMCIIPSDMPFITEKMLTELKNRFLERNLDAVSFYKKSTPVPPSIFSNRVFPEILNLEGDRGAKKILENLENKGFIRGYESNLLDIDTAEDYMKLFSEGVKFSLV